MNPFTRWRRSTAALTAAAAAVSLTAATADAAPVRTATTTTYTHATYLQHALGLQANPVVESVTYDRLQWLLQQPGKFAVLLGDPALDPTFAARAQDVDATAKAAGVKRVYWFDPNLSGSATVGTIQEPALDIRNPSAIPLPTTSQNKYGDAWLNVVGQHLGNGLTITVNDPLDEDQTVKVDKTANANDYGSTNGFSTKVGDINGGALYDYTAATPANVTHSYFFVYDKDATVTPDGSSAKPAKIVSWVDLNSSATPKADVGTAIAKVGAGNLTRIDQFAWFKSEVNARQLITSSTDARGKQVPVLTDAANAAADGGWRINQVTYPELVDLFKSGANTANAVILFGGTWCPNTRPVLPGINKYAQENDVTVFNFDTVLDGAAVGGLATSAVNPLQIRNTAAYQSTDQANPSFLYGDLLDQYLTNIKTQYDPATSSVVTFYKGAGAGASSKARKLQVPFVIGYQGKTGDAPNGGVTRQWIIDKGNDAYTEYMSQWWFTNPQPNQLGLTIPLTAPIWQTINAQVPNVTWQTNPATLVANTAVDTDDGQFLVDADKANVTYNPAGNGSVTTSANANGTVVISPAALSGALTALGASAPANNVAARTAYIAAQKATPQDPELIAKLTTVVGAWGVAQTRKNSLNNAWGNATSPGSVIGGLSAVHALDVFFGGLPGGVVSRRTVTAAAVKAGTAPSITVSIANDYGRVPAGTVSVVLKRAGATVATGSAAVANGAAAVTLPAHAEGTYDYALSYAGDDQIAAFTEMGTLTVTPGDKAADPEPTPQPTVQPTATPTPTPVTPVVVKSKVTGAVAKAPTSRKAGKYKVTITGTTATGKVTIKLKKGAKTKTVTGTLKNGVVTVSVPKLAKGTWKVTISWSGGSATGASIKVKK